MSELAVYSTVAVSLNAGLLIADICMVARAGQGRAVQCIAVQMKSSCK